MKVFGWTTNPTTLTLDTSAEATAINLGALAETQVQKATSWIEIGRNLDSRVQVQNTNKTYEAVVSQEQLDNINPNDPSTFVKIKLPTGVVFDKDFKIDGIDYDILMHPDNIDKWSLNPSTGEIILKDKELYLGDASTNEVQRIILVGASTGDTFTLQFTNPTTGITESANITVPDIDNPDYMENLRSAIEIALNGLSNLGTNGNINVEIVNGAFHATFCGDELSGVHLDLLFDSLDFTGSVSNKISIGADIY